jgi:hypothetical protein
MAALIRTRSGGGGDGAAGIGCDRAPRPPGAVPVGFPVLDGRGRITTILGVNTAGYPHYFVGVARIPVDPQTASL